MSDTLLEAEDAETLREHERRGGEYRCSACGREFKKVADYGKHKCEADYCNECKGPAHAPWCAEYKEPVVECQFCDFKGSFIDGTKHRRDTQHLLRTVATGNLRRSEAATAEHQPAAPGGGDDEWIDKLLDAAAYAQDVDRRVAARLQIKHAVNQHQSLVAERERLRGAIEVAIHNLNAGNDPKFLADYLRLTLDQNRTTPQ